ncbi:hypothetical protein GUJ93_ZPchr1777g18706 [Zizania palustris]|uniref:Protein kinase domain-containing protein n=1 Tax=Zizania palustris TaxID=103762 RepID=A0A8J5R640_ZIZPA|nr:hypothetical protein GUJ93_ZPchr1777g18706 [Zizania palustris]
MHRWIIASCGDMRPLRPVRRRDDASKSASASALPPRLRKMGSEAMMLAVPKDLKAATGYYSPEQIIGEGGFGVVYKGFIHGAEVAVKELNPEGLQGDREWLTEVNYLGQYSHPNLVELIGYCCDDDHRLFLRVHGQWQPREPPLSTFMQPVMDGQGEHRVGRGQGARLPPWRRATIIYRDFKTSNILLDADLKAKLSDFGLAKEGPMGGKTHVSTRVMGTYGYAAPEYMATGHLTAMSDVYGFGVVLLEMLVGRRALEPPSSRLAVRQGGSLVDWARPILIRTKKLEKILDHRMGLQLPQGEHGASPGAVERVARLAYDCLSQNPKVRPAMERVVRTLEAVLAGDGALAIAR